MKAVHIMVSLLALSIATPALAEDWRAMEPGTDNAYDIDKDSIRADGSQRHFRTRKQTEGGVVYMNDIVDCAANYADILSLEFVRDGKTLAQKDYKPGEQRHLLDAEVDAPMKMLVCGR